jgi:hypothetical protein
MVCLLTGYVESHTVVVRLDWQSVRKYLPGHGSVSQVPLGPSYGSDGAPDAGLGAACRQAQSRVRNLPKLRHLDYSPAHRACVAATILYFIVYQRRGE